MPDKRVLSILLISITTVSSIVVIFVVLNPFDEGDTIAPTVVISSPVSGVYPNVTHQLTITASDAAGVDTIWFNWAGTNETYTTSQSVVFPEGSTTIHAWANDTVGNVGLTSVIISIFTFSEPFISEWNTTLTSSGSSANDTIKLPLELGGTYGFAVDWGDGF